MVAASLKSDHAITGNTKVSVLALSGHFSEVPFVEAPVVESHSYLS